MPSPPPPCRDGGPVALRDLLGPLAVEIERRAAAAQAEREAPMGPLGLGEWVTGRVGAPMPSKNARRRWDR